MTDSIDDDDVTRFDNRVPADLHEQQQIEDYLGDNIGSFSDDAAEAFARKIASRREAPDDTVPSLDDELSGVGDEELR